MACRLPGSIQSPEQLWEFLLSKGDARSRIPESRYNVDAYYSSMDKPGSTKTQHGYFLDNDLSLFDSSSFTMSPMELARCDPQQRLMLEVARECIEDAGETEWKGRRIGVYVGNFGDDWNEMLDRDIQQYGVYRVAGSGDFALANRVSYEMDLRGPSMTIRTACSSSLVSLNEACLAIARGDCSSAIVGGTSLILTPSMTIKLSEQGVLSADGSCKTFSASANGYGRGEAINGLYIKPLADALRDGNPVRAVIRATATNHDGKTPGMTYPSAEAQEALIRHAYGIAGIADFSDTTFVECHGTGTYVGDPIETKAVTKVFGHNGIYIGSVKPNLGHSEGASGLTSVIKAVLALENRTIPPNIKLGLPNPNIPFESAKLTVPVEPTPWPKSSAERVSVNSFGIGGNNAHVILDSAASHHASTELKEASDTPQLLLYSANSPESLQKVIENYTTYLSRYPERIEDLAFTLANRRQHLSHRSFAVASREKPGTPAPLAKPTQPSNLIMVFTGQGAQWPQMGRALLRSNPVFKASIQESDKHLKGLGEEGPDWTIEAELRKPAKTSRLGTAELSQPLCTALQIGLVDSLAAIGIVPNAVVGHSSGEIAAAYASGALTAQEAITAAFHRGLVAKKQSRPGAMAAIGMGWAEVKPFLIPTVDVACENSPKSVTLSGDAEKVKDVVAAIQKARPEVLARLLKVEKAYHSYHMAEVGEDYYRLVGPKMIGRSPSKLFFSSVTGKLLGEGEALGAKYWQKNLESPVLFSSAVSRIAEHPVGKNAVFLEVGPHSALAGPLRQILAANASSGAYVAAMVRGENCTEAFLSAVGKLYTLHIQIDFKKMMPEGVSLPGLPQYPWNHQKSHWHENRVTREWRHRQHPYHDLLGVRALESAEFTPVWRNVFHIDNAPWVRDHKVGGDIVFPFAAYVAMAGEAVRQVSGVQEGFTVRNVEAITALVIAEGTPVELVTAFQRHEVDKDWWKFTIGSHNGHVWTRHCAGDVTSLQQSLGSSAVIEELPRKIAASSWYDVLRRAGLDFGPRFQCLDDMRASTTGIPGRSTATIYNKMQGDEGMYHQHPVAIDAALHLTVCAAAYGIGLKHRNNVATGVGQMSILRSSENVLVATGSGSFTRNGSVRGSGYCLAESKVVMRMSGVKHNILEAPQGEDLHAAAYLKWKPHIDFIDTQKLIKLSFDKAVYMSTLNELAQLCMLRSWISISSFKPTVPHLEKYKAWLELQISSMKPSSQAWRALDDQSLRERIERRVEHLSGTPADPVARALLAVNLEVDSVFSGKKDAWDIMHESDVHSQLYAFIDNFNNSSLLAALAHTRPTLRVLELGAGKGVSTTRILKSLGSSFSKYTFSDVSSSSFQTAKEQFKGVPNIEFSVLDIGKDLEQQGFAESQYDLVIATNIVHQTESLSRSFDNLRALLVPDGRLILQELCPSSQWINYVLGLLPKWWSTGRDGGPCEPYLDIKGWEEELHRSGFCNIMAVPDADEPFQLSATFVAKPDSSKRPVKKVALLCTEPTSNSESVAEELQRRNFEVTFCTLDDSPPTDKDIISLLDQESSFFATLSAEVFARLKIFLGSVTNAGIFWITPLTSLHCQNPQYAQTLGFARTMRSELGIDFAVCETDTNFGDHHVLEVFEHFQLRDDITRLHKDMEYIIHEGEVKVPRIHPFSLGEALVTSSEDDHVILTTNKPGRLSDLHWAYKPTKSLVGDEVEIEVYSVGLNSRDVAIATGSLEVPELVFGQEAAGIIRRAGPEVQDFQIGDRVMVVGHCTCASVIVQSEALCIKLPDSLTFNEGAILPIVYSTAFHALVNLARLAKEQSILIHSGGSAIGLAAIQIACSLKAKIFATVADEQQASHLIENFDVPRCHIFLTSDSKFPEALLEVTSGQGVDFVLNSLTGELGRASWLCVAEFGMVIETEKAEISESQVPALQANRSYCLVDIGHIQANKPAIMKQLLAGICQLYSEGLIRPIRPRKIFNASQIQDAFAELKDTSTGDIAVEVRESNTDGSVAFAINATKRKITPQFDPSASYLLVGGLGGLGRSVSTWMVENGAKNMIFLSRNAGKGPEDKAFVNELVTMGCAVQLVQGSVSDPNVVARAIQTASAPIKGILQMSMVLRDESFSKMSWNDWDAATAPKTEGTWNLHNATLAAGITLDFFVMFSSISGIIGQPGQANYAGANTFLDAFCNYRQQQGLAASVINFGPIDGVGVLSQKDDLLRQMKATGFYCIGGKEVLDGVLVATTPSTGSRTSFLLGFDSTIPLDSDKNRLPWRNDPRMAAYHNRKGGVASGSEASGSDGLKGLLNRARTDPSILDSLEALEILAREIGLKVLRLLSKADDELNTSLGLADLGMDSLVAIEMRMWWKQTFRFDISVLEMMGKGTLEVLAKHAADGIRRSFE
ncbi:polyketide synthase [Xylona heveae TC161]|uniref:Polyketide synthase n=1 Tax=Xylona heveae (strain CBS 132557 / TC161) TaxID=1328760 RepID=A0A165G7Q2_XYLHT|nr:polyketide synthase [Xylona heveae TC161]KZF21837.1 polyketide synthase [Xylona heveae TC161]